MLTTTRFDTLVALAGPEFTYPGVRGGSRPNGKARPALREWLRVAQGDRCAHIGCDVPLSVGTVELCHVVSRGPLVLGFLHGNLYAGHKGCNADAAAISPVLGPDVLDFALIADTFPGMTELIRWHAAR